jgi:hypothetical protein
LPHIKIYAAFLIEMLKDIEGFEKSMLSNNNINKVMNVYGKTTLKSLFL